MPKQSYSLDAGGPKSLQLIWGVGYKNFKILLDGNTIGQIEGGLKSLLEGREFALPDGRTLQVKFEQRFMAGGLRVDVDGKPVPGSEGDPLSKVRGAAGLLIFIASINLLFGILALVGVGFLKELGAGWFSIVVGLMYLGLGLWSRRPSMLALLLSTAIYGIDSLVSIYSRLMAFGASSLSSGLLFRAVVIYYLIAAILAMRKIKQNSLVKP